MRSRRRGPASWKPSGPWAISSPDAASPRPLPGRSPARRFAAALLLLLLLGLAATTLAPTLFPPPAAPAAEGPADIVLVVWDTCRGDRVSAMGYGKPTTPFLDTVAAGGVAFTRCYTPSPWTPPAHASLFTGLLPVHHGLREGVGETILPDLEPLATTLSRAGYETVAASANPLVGGTGLLRGFEITLPLKVAPGEHKINGEAVVDAIRRWLPSRRVEPGPRRPLFLFVNLMDSHLPYQPLREDLAAVHGEAEAARIAAIGPLGDDMDALGHLVGARRFTPGRLADLSLAYDGAVHRTDRLTAALCGLLENEGILPGGLLAVVGDHGEMLGEHDLVEHRLSLYDPVLHVPLVLRWPGRFEGGRREDAQVRVQDLYPTLLAAGGATAPAACGRDALSLLGGTVEPRRVVSQLKWAHSFVPMLRSRFPELGPEAFDVFRLGRIAVREASRGPTTAKLLITRRLMPDGTVRDEGSVLHDVSRDPGETRDLLAPDGAGSPAETAAARAAAKELGKFAAPYAK